MVEVGDRLEELSQWGWTLFAATVFAVAGAALAALISIVLLTPYAAMFFPLGAGIGAFLSGGVLWWVAIERLGSTSDSPGLPSGASRPFLLTS